MFSGKLASPDAVTAGAARLRVSRAANRSWLAWDVPRRLGNYSIPARQTGVRADEAGRQIGAVAVRSGPRVDGITVGENPNEWSARPGRFWDFWPDATSAGTRHGLFKLWRRSIETTDAGRGLLPLHARFGDVSSFRP